MDNRNSPLATRHSPLVTHSPLILLLIVYFLMGGLYAVLTPAWETPDEPAHYNYVRQLANGRFPIMEAGDYDQEYLITAVFEEHFSPAYPIDPISYEDWQPPLYYLLQTPVYQLSNGSLIAMRLFSLFIGAGVVVMAYLTARRIFPNEEWLVWTTAVFVALLPQHLAMMASVNNDSFAELIIATLLWLLVGIVARPKKEELRRLRRFTQMDKEWLGVGVLLGLGFLTKGTVYTMGFIVLGLLIWRFWGDWRNLIRTGLLVFVPAGLLASLWWGRNLIVYGGFDIFGKTTHDAVVIGQPRTADWIADLGAVEVVRRFLTTTFHSFWGQFGWMTVPMNGRVYQLLGLLSAAALVGFLLHLFNKRGKRPSAAMVLLTAVFLFSIAVHVGYNITFVQHQGRYLFPALIPIALAGAIGLGVWIRPFARRHQWLNYAVPVGLALFLLTLNLYALFRVILPALT